MSNETGISSLRRVAIPDLLKHNFFIPDYQRGYRWESKQILQLIEDVHGFFQDVRSGSFYCLQPIVVKECSKEVIERHALRSDIDDNRWYEVIDGQQRLTTIRVLLAFYFAQNPLDARQPFKIAYETRPEVAVLFDRLVLDLRTRSFSYSEQNVANSEQNVAKSVDRKFIENCIRTVFGCFTHEAAWRPGEPFHLRLQDFGGFLENLMKNGEDTKSVQVLWYETFEECDARDIFERINDLRIPLSNSEIIRAMFLSESAKYAYEGKPAKGDPGDDAVLRMLKEQDRHAKQLHINARWDEMEHRLRNDDFWAFITNQRPETSRNRIEVLFDLISKKYVPGQDGGGVLNKDDPLYTYLYFDAQIKEGRYDLWRLWRKVEACFSRLCYWYENDDCYHRIGYLVLMQPKGDQALSELLEQADVQDNDEFVDEVADRIKAQLPRPEEIAGLSYEDTSGKIKSLLILHNIESCRGNAVVGRFPFALFKRRGREKGWTLEHIHAQNSECLPQNDKAPWLEWAKVNLEALRNNGLAEDPHLIPDLVEAVEKLTTGDNRYTHDRIVGLFDRVAAVYQSGPVPRLHQLSNLALLDGGVNAGIGNSAFEVKRQYVAKADADGDYVPYCTRKVFAKLYYPKDSDGGMLLSRRTYAWDEEDRKCYLDDIREKLSPYIPMTAYETKEV